MAYVYKHIRLDKNEVFYIGIGDGDNYRRSKNKHQRNNIWNKIAKKTKYIIEIAFDNLSYEEALQKEKELIKLYGRIDLGTGILSNLTDGGEGTKGCIHSPESILKTTNSVGYKNRKIISGTKNKSWEEIYGYDRAQELRRTRRLPIIKRGKDHPFYGKKRPDHSMKMKGRSFPKPTLRGENNVMKRKEVAEKVSKARLGVPRPKLECPHCGKVGGTGNMQRWHFDNCKNKI